MKQRLQEIASELLAIANEMVNAPQVEAEERKTITFQTISNAIRIGNIEIKPFGLDEDGNPISLVRNVRD